MKLEYNNLRTRAKALLRHKKFKQDESVWQSLDLSNSKKALLRECMLGMMWS